MITAHFPPFDNVNNPKHYTQHPSGVECIQVTEHLSFCIGNAIKYLWRADLKNGLEDLQKAQWYINREISRRQAVALNQHGTSEPPPLSPECAALIDRADATEND
jgi:hypothetical protein